jgi:hypothetical protein
MKLVWMMDGHYFLYRYRQWYLNNRTNNRSNQGSHCQGIAVRFIRAK